MLTALIKDIEHIEQKKAQLDRLRPLSPGALSNLEHANDLELTYTSNAIEGNTLSQIETNLVIEQGITIGPRPNIRVTRGQLPFAYAHCH
jgi:Fic family protein